MSLTSSYLKVVNGNKKSLFMNYGDTNIHDAPNDKFCYENRGNKEEILTKSNHRILLRNLGNNWNEFYSGYTYQAPKEVVESMDDDKLLEKYLDSVNQNIRDMEHRITEDSREREKRVEEERRLSEDRMEKKFIEAMDAVKNQNKIIDKHNDRIESKYENLKWWILGTCLTTILAIAAMILSLGNKISLGK